MENCLVLTHSLTLCLRRGKESLAGQVIFFLCAVKMEHFEDQGQKEGVLKRSYLVDLKQECVVCLSVHVIQTPCFIILSLK